MEKNTELGTTYRGAVNWLVGLAVTAIAGAISLHLDSQPQRFAMGFFSITVLSGVLLQFWDIRAQTALDWIRAKTSETPGVAALQPLTIESLQIEFHRARRSRNGYHYVALTSFVLGVFLSIVSLAQQQPASDLEASPADCEVVASREVVCAEWLQADGSRVRVVRSSPGERVGRTTR